MPVGLQRQRTSVPDLSTATRHSDSAQRLGTARLAGATGRAYTRSMKKLHGSVVVFSFRYCQLTQCGAKPCLLWQFLAVVHRDGHRVFQFWCARPLQA